MYVFEMSSLYIISGRKKEDKLFGNCVLDQLNAAESTQISRCHSA